VIQVEQVLDKMDFPTERKNRVLKYTAHEFHESLNQTKKTTNYMVEAQKTWGKKNNINRDKQQTSKIPIGHY